MRNVRIVFASLFSMAAASAAYAADLPLPSVKGPPPILAGSPIEFQFGARYWYSSGNYQKDLYDPFTTAVKNSRLTYGDISGHSAELFFRADHQSGFFLKGFIGGGALSSGKMNDEDFPPGNVPYSNTLQVQSGGSMKYASVDLGYNLLAGALPTGQAFRIGPFVGYHHLHDRMNTFGCSQVSIGAICATNPIGLTPIPTLYDTLDEDITWNSLRAGIAGEVVILPGLRASLEAAWAHNWLKAYDYHNLRPDIRGIPEDGEGDGFQLEGLISYDLTPRFSVGLGGRYWQFNATGKAHWEQVIAGALNGIPSAPLQTHAERYGVFLQAAYRFGGPDDKTGAGDFGPNFGKAEAEPHRWDGFYAGANVGYGFGASGTTQFASQSFLAAVAQLQGAIPASQKSDIGGFIGGGQIGYNRQFAPMLVAGLEADLQYANIGGSFGYTDPMSGFTTSSKSLLEWLGTVRGRIGWLLRDDFLLYGTGGFAYGDVAARSASTAGAGFACSVPINTCSAGASSTTATGWTAGAGLEYAIAHNLTLKTEWLYVDLGKQNYSLYDSGVTALLGFPVVLAASSDSKTHIIRTGVNYRFDWPSAPAPVVAKY